MRRSNVTYAQGRPDAPNHPPAPHTLHPAQRPTITWQEEADAADARALPVRRGPQFVPPARQTVDVPAVRLADPSASLVVDVTPVATIEGKTIGGHQDRAAAWLRYSLPLCATVAAAILVAAVALWSVPLLSFTALLIYLLAFVISYSGLLLRYWSHTPEGVALFHARNQWAYLFREQDHRHQIEAEAWADQRALTHRNNNDG